MLEVANMPTFAQAPRGSALSQFLARQYAQRALMVMAAISIVAAAQSVSAADLPAQAYAKAGAVPGYSWSGCYIGANGGGGRSNNDWGILLGAIVTADVHSSGFVAGGQVGCDYQVGNLVAGVEGQFDWSDLHGQAMIPPQGAPAQDVSKLDRFATATGRIGYAFDRVLPYVKGGFAWAHFNHDFDIAVGPAFVPSIVASQGVVGFVVGAGIEVAFLPNWSLKAEYNYLDFGKNGVQFSCVVSCAPTPSPFPVDIRQNAQLVTLGVNYRFGPGHW
jgi:outer membrane immunogenic protein